VRHACHQKPNPSRETIPLNLKYLEDFSAVNFFLNPTFSIV
jgi:hypothetical protein